MNTKLPMQTNTVSLIPKKYRGDDDDPHFIPNSPIISRQELSAQEEGELKRICALVLANVPHSDDMSDDPLKYIATQIQEGTKIAQPSIGKQEQKPDPVQNIETTASVTHQFLDAQGDSTTPSEASHRDTISATDYSTPLTSAGMTPGETARRFSDAARKSITGAKKPGSNLRNDSNNMTNSRTTSTGVRSLEAHKHSGEAEAIKKTLRLITDGESSSQRGSAKSMEQSRPLRFSAPDLNKSLPPPPPESSTLEDQKQPHISRLMKSIRKKKSMTAEGKSFSTGSTPPVPAMPSTNAPKTPYPYESSNQTAAQEPPKKKFRIPNLFHRRQRPADVLVT
ncbi:hypothetical protein A1O7_03442 [Cladophialophora yegresii CBS 114405]|uniref:Uncharacterized protein n=1 Tax=Cladophialophora yegresii CBS 114405 TaxID=1182544 RepID=W9W4X1_9EURO|nr:uncharacterized protein A1O7_03442 [Cladophialophora yegresii CBS 114405]EXJ62998.1 hypothetical protein A1O7_03442 [Cladophialophora yegresii CBS 114405]